MDEPQTQSTSPAPSTADPKFKFSLPSSVKAGLLVFLLASALVLVGLPHLAGQSGNSPSYMLLLGAGLVVVLFNVALFKYLSGLKLGFGKTALVLAAGYNAILIMIKLFLSPFALYQSNQSNQFDAQIADPNTAFYYVLVGVVILMLYVAAFILMYRYFYHRAQVRLGQATKKPHNVASMVKIGPYVVGLILLFWFGGSFLFVPALAAAPSAEYLTYIFGALALPLIIALVLAVFLAYRGYQVVEEQAVSTRNVALIGSFFWVGLSLIFIYHILWVVFMLTLVQIWPFQTYTPK